MNEIHTKWCGICTKPDGRYQCPRCNILYCSAECYKNPVHSECSEQFYKECVESEMSSFEPNSLESQKKMYEILKRMKETMGDDVDEFDEDKEHLDSDDEELDEDDDTDLADRLKNVNLDDADKVWERLTDTEKQQFEELLKSNDVTEVLPEFEPWWNYKDDRKVVDLEEALPFETEHKSKCPKIESNILALSKISKASPSSTVCYNLANVLAAYVFVVRHFNGDHEEEVSESTVNIITLSKNLLANENYLDFTSSIKAVSLEIINSEFLLNCGDVSDIITSDVMKIFEGPQSGEINKSFYVLCALSDIHRLFSKAIKCYNADNQVASCSRMKCSEFSKRFPESSVSALPCVPKLKIKNCLKKIEYYMSWANEFCNSLSL